jgi:hypothetical protein
MRTWTLLALLWTVPVWAQPAPTPAPTQNAAGLSPDQMKVIKDNLRGISDVMGVPKPEEAAAKPDTPTKSMADVADHALEMMSGLVVKVAGTLEKVAPKFWAIMVKQQYAKAVADTIVPVSLTAFALAWGLYFKKKLGYPPLTQTNSWTDSQWVQFWFAILIPAAGLCAFFVWSAIAVSDAAKYVINPEYYAVRDILMMFSQPGNM